MSGAAQTAINFANPISAGVLNLVRGNNPLESMGQSISQVGGVVMNKAVNPLMQGVGLAPGAVPNIAAADPNAVASQQQAAKILAAQNAQKQLQTNQPGRGGTLLTNNYAYNTNG